MKKVVLLFIALCLLGLCFDSFAGTLNDYNSYNVSIPDNGGAVSSDLMLSGAPSGAKITKVKVYYEIRHTYPGDLDLAWFSRKVRRL